MNLNNYILGHITIMLIDDLNVDIVESIIARDKINSRFYLIFRWIRWEVIGGWVTARQHSFPLILLMNYSIFNRRVEIKQFRLGVIHVVGIWMSTGKGSLMFAILFVLMFPVSVIILWICVKIKIKAIIFISYSHIW